MNSDYGVIAFMEKCAHYTTCKSCTSDRRCGYFFDTGVCVPGGWLAPRGNYTNSGDAWSYYHGHCFISTRKEFVMLPAICGLLILMLAVAALWQSWPARWFGFSLRGPTTPRASPGRGSSCDDSHHNHMPNEHMPLLIDNDPRSRQHAQRVATASHDGPRESVESPAIPQTRRREANAGDGVVAGTSFEEQYGSWCQRSGNMVQGGALHGG